MQEHEILLSKLKMEFQISEEAHQRILHSFEKGTTQPKRWGPALHTACMDGQSIAGHLPLQLHTLWNPIACFCPHSLSYSPGSASKSVRNLGHCSRGMTAKQVCLALLTCSARASTAAAQFEADYVPPAPKSRSGTKAKPKSAVPGMPFAGAAGGGSKAKGGSKASKKRKAR